MRRQIGNGVDHARGGVAKLLRRLGFRLVGRLRRSHRLDDQIVDRLWFDLLAEEHGAS